MITNRARVLLLSAPHPVRSLVNSMSVLTLVVVLAGSALACADSARIAGPVIPPQSPSSIFGEGGPCETADIESYKWCYVIWGSRLTVAPGPSCNSNICWATFPLGTEYAKFTATRDLLLASSHQECKEAGGRLDTLLRDNRVSYWVPQDTDGQGGTVMGTNWTSGQPYGTVAIQFWKGLLTGYSPARIHWEIAHELGHDRYGEDETSAWAFATLCFGLKPAS